MPELIIIGVICMLFFGPRQIPKLAKGLGETIREFRNAGKELQGVHDEAKDTARVIDRELRS